MDCFGRDINSTFNDSVYIGGDLEVVESIEVKEDLIVEGSLIVKDQVAYEDAVIILNDFQGRLNDSYNWGLIAPYVSSGQKWSGFVRSFTDSRFKLINNSATEITSTQTTFPNLGNLDLSNLTATASLTTPEINHGVGLSVVITSNAVMNLTPSDTLISNDLQVLGDCTLGNGDIKDLPVYTVTNGFTNPVDTGTTYKQFGFNFLVHQNIDITHFQLQTALALTGTQWYMTLWNVSGSVKVHSEYVLNSDPVVDGSYTHELSAPISVLAGSNYLLVWNALTTGANKKYLANPNISNSNAAYITCIGAAYDNSGGGSGSATETGNTYPATVLTGLNYTNAGNLLFAQSNNFVIINSTDMTVNEPMNTENVLPITTDTHTLGSLTKRYDEGDIRFLRNNVLNFNGGDNESKITINTTTGSTTSLLVQDSDLTALMTINSNGDGEQISHKVETETKNVVPATTDMYDIGTTGLKYNEIHALDLNTSTMDVTTSATINAPNLTGKTTALDLDAKIMTFTGGNSENQINVPTTTGASYGLQFQNSNVNMMKFVKNGTYPTFGRVIMGCPILNSNGNSVTEPGIAFQDSTYGWWLDLTKVNLSLAGVKTFQWGPSHTYSVPPLYNVRDRYDTLGAPVVTGICSAIDNKVIAGDTGGDVDLTTNTLVGSNVIKANTVKQGDNVSITIGGIMTIANNDTGTFFLKLGTTKVATLPVITFPTLSGIYWQIEAEITFRSDYNAVSPIAALAEFSFPDSTASKQSTGASNTTNVDLTVDNAITAGIVWGQSNAADSMTTHQFVVNACFW